jgi:hypothetical protein
MNFRKHIHKWPLSQAIPSLLRILPAVYLTLLQVGWLPLCADGLAQTLRLDVRGSLKKEGYRTT